MGIAVAGAADERQRARQDPCIYGLLDRVYVWHIQFGDLPEEILLFYERQEIHQPTPLIPFGGGIA
jgi:hypothetical protein